MASKERHLGYVDGIKRAIEEIGYTREHFTRIGCRPSTQLEYIERELKRLIFKDAK